MKYWKSLQTLLIACLFMGVLWAEKDLDRLSLGEGWLNAIPLEEFAGRVIVVEMWGIN